MQIKGFHNRMTIAFQVGKTFWTEQLENKNFPLDGQTQQAKLSSLPVDLLGTQPLIKPSFKSNFIFMW